MKVTDLYPRLVDGWGSGAYRASRGSRTHKGVDLMCYAGMDIDTHVTGTVTKLGYTYGDDLSYRYVEVTTDNNCRHRFFYVEPLVEVGQYVVVGDHIGEAQDIQKRYRLKKPSNYMCNHIHYEILQKDGTPLNPGV